MSFSQGHVQGLGYEGRIHGSCQTRRFKRSSAEVHSSHKTIVIDAVAEFHSFHEYMLTLQVRISVLFFMHEGLVLVFRNCTVTVVILDPKLFPRLEVI